MKRIIFFLMLILSLTLSLTLAACNSSAPKKEFTVEMSEFAYSPETIEVQVGDEVVIHLSNKGALAHEFMVGQNMEMEDNAPATFEHNLFEKQGPVMSGGSDDHNMDAMSTGGHDHGFMVIVPQGGEEMTMTFTVTEDMVGEWEIGCFVDGGSHYMQGMTGKLIVTP